MGALWGESTELVRPTAKPCSLKEDGAHRAASPHCPPLAEPSSPQACSKFCTLGPKSSVGEGEGWDGPHSLGSTVDVGEGAVKGGLLGIRGNFLDQASWGPEAHPHLRPSSAA